MLSSALPRVGVCAAAVAAFALAPTAPRSAHAQQAPAGSPTPVTLNVGDVAPDFTLPGATRFGVLRDPVHLAAFRGKTVVLAFFFKARTKG
ncbi:MAG: hypothetical protein NVS4B3_23320 [Gemmatimonadaceae bacterium]